MSIEQLIIAVVVIAISGLSNWLQKRRQRELEKPFQDESAPPLPQPGSRRAEAPSAPAKPLFDLDEELRRLLGGEPPVASQPPKPVIIETKPAPKPAPPPVPARTVREVEYTESEEPAAREMGRLPQAAQAYQRAESLAETIGARMNAVDPHGMHPSPAAQVSQASPVPPNLAQAVRQLRNPTSIKQAILASVIIGRPKSLEVEVV
ncbi:MAG: hypothetical protein EXS31_10955 [Pedosphaera sp.]|nr:hypothetical protein [Pedosphaera sp.]